MLILILTDVQYSQKASFGFEKGSVGQNHSSSGSHCPIKKPNQQNSVLSGNCYFKMRKFTLQLNQTHYSQKRVVDYRGVFRALSNI